MSTIKTTNITHGSNSGTANVVLDSSGNATINGNATVTGNLSVTGTVTSSINQYAATSTSGATNYTWESIPAGWKRISLIFANVSMSGTDSVRIELGGSSYYTSNYLCTSGFVAGTSGNAQEFGVTDSFMVYSATAANTMGGIGFICPGTTGTSETYSFSYRGTNNTSTSYGGGFLTGVSDAITKVKIRSSGTNTFDGGTVSLMYEL